MASQNVVQVGRARGASLFSHSVCSGLSFFFLSRDGKKGELSEKYLIRLQSGARGRRHLLRDGMSEIDEIKFLVRGCKTLALTEVETN